MKLKVVNTNILVEVVKEKEEGIIADVEENIVKGEVKEIGTGLMIDGRSTPMQVRPSSQIWFDKRNGLQLPFNENLYVIDQSDIILIEED